MTTQVHDGTTTRIDPAYEIERAIVMHDAQMSDAQFVHVRLRAAQILAAHHVYLVALGLADAAREIWRELVLVALLCCTILAGLHYGAFSWYAVAGALALVVWVVVAFVMGD